VALSHAPRPIAAPGPSLTLLRGRKPDRRSEAEEAWMEVHAAGSEMKAMAERITNSLVAGDLHSAHHFASRLWTLGHSYTNPEGDAA
jgi:hypothetical protein